MIGLNVCRRISDFFRSAAPNAKFALAIYFAFKSICQAFLKSVQLANTYKYIYIYLEHTFV